MRVWCNLNTLLRDALTRTHGNVEHECRQEALLSTRAHAWVPMFILCLLASVPLGQLMSNVKPSQALDSLPTTSRRSARARSQDSDKVPDCHNHRRAYALTAACKWVFCYPFNSNCVNSAPTCSIWGACEFEPMSDCLLTHFGFRC